MNDDVGDGDRRADWVAALDGLAVPAVVLEAVGMELVWGAIAWLAGTVLFTVAFRLLSRANTAEKIPFFFGRPKNSPAEIYIYRAIGMALLILSFFAWADLLGYWALLFILFGTIPSVILNARHNFQARRLMATVVG